MKKILDSKLPKGSLIKSDPFVLEGGDMSAIEAWFLSTPSIPAILAAAILATVGWIYTARKSRMLMRRQHTFNALLQASFDERFQTSLDNIRDHIRAGCFPDLNLADNETLKRDVVFLLNHYEFLAAGIRLGDISEKLLKDSERGTIISLFKTSEPFILAVKDNRKRMTTFEHIEWLYERWHEKPCTWWQILLEFIAGRPLYENYYQWLILASLIFVIIIVGIVVHAHILG